MSGATNTHVCLVAVQKETGEETRGGRREVEERRTQAGGRHTSSLESDARRATALHSTEEAATR